jgi:hypothetical protein
MPNVSVYVDEKLYEKMKRYPEVKWSQICREAIERYIREREGKKIEIKEVKY